MKCLIFVIAVVALVSAADEKKPLKEEEKKPIDDKHVGLQWPLPDPTSEGDLLLHGSISFDRVRALHKGKVEDDVDKMILAHGRLFLRRVSKFFDENATFKVMPILCHDSLKLNANGTNNRWKIEIPKVQQAAPAEAKEQVQRDQPLPKEKSENDAPHNNTGNENETTTIQPSTSQQPSSERPSSERPSSERPSSERPSSERPSSERPSSERPSSELPSSEKPSSEKPSDKPSTTVRPPVEPSQEKETYEARRHEFYRQVGANFARLLMKEHRKEQLNTEETEYLARWIADEAVHYGAHAIYCNEGEDIKEIKKQLVIYLEEKP